MINIAVILAAGSGKRLKDKAKEKPKGFLEVGNKSLIEYSISKLLSVNIKKIIIGTGYLSEYYEELKIKYPMVECVKNESFTETGSLYTFYNLREKIMDDFILLESDLLYDRYGLESVINDNHKDIILSSQFTNSSDEVYIEVDENINLVNLSKKSGDLNNIYSEFVGINKISFETFKIICEFAKKEFEVNKNIDYEYALVFASKIKEIYVKKMEDYIWCEIDDEEHLNRALNFVFPEIKKRESDVKY